MAYFYGLHYNYWFSERQFTYYSRTCCYFSYICSWCRNNSSCMHHYFFYSQNFSGIIKTNSTDSNDVEPIIPSYSKSDYAPESASEPEDTVESYVSPEPQIPVYDTMEGHDFEYYCAELLKNNGFYNVSVTQGSGDQGIDVLAEKGGVKYGIQCKCYSSDIGNKAVQEAFSGCRYYNCHVPVVMTNRYFTRQAKDLAQKTNVLLWDRDILNKYIQVSQGGKL